MSDKIIKEPGDNFPRKAFLNTNGWEGVRSKEVEVIGETPQRWRIRAIERTKLAGRNRWLNPGETVLVPKHAVTDEPLKDEYAGFEYPEDTPQWLRDLHFMAQENKPLFSGLLENDSWKTSEQEQDLREWLEKGWVALIEGVGFIITDAGRKVVRDHDLEF